MQVTLAERRIGELQTLTRQGVTEEKIEALQERWEEHIGQAIDRAEGLTENKEEVKERTLEQIDRHRAVIEKVRGQVPDQAKDAIDRAIKNYETNREKLLKNFNGTRLEEIEERLRNRLEKTIERLELNRERFQQLKDR